MQLKSFLQLSMNFSLQIVISALIAIVSADKFADIKQIVNVSDDYEVKWLQNLMENTHFVP